LFLFVLGVAMYQLGQKHKGDVKKDLNEFD
jgi:hypothetical protein